MSYFIRFYWSYSIKVVGIGYAANAAQIIPNPRRVITVFLILCKLGLSHALTCLSYDFHLLLAFLPAAGECIEGSYQNDGYG